jgi:hypothetical protein
MTIKRTMSWVQLAGAALATLCLAAGPAQAEVIRYGPNEAYRPIFDPADLVFNGNFNLDPLVDPDNPNAANPNITGWVISPPSEFPGTRNSNVGVGPDGRGLRMGDYNLIEVSQSLATEVGQTYRLSFFLAQDGEPDTLLRVFAGNALLAPLDGYQGLPGYAFFSQYLYTFTATTAHTALLFQYQSPVGDQYLSNVTVLAVPDAQTWALMLLGLAAVRHAVRLRR